MFIVILPQKREKMNSIYGLILASGTGERTGLNIPKQFFKINA